MNDRFKVRAFCLFYNEEQGFVYSDVKNGLYKAFFSNFDAMNAHFLAIEQCTGLKYKNGKLIYEGDIIRHDTVAGPKHWAVEFKNGCFVLAYESGDAWLMKVIEHCPYDSGVVVVGNIHENPELLEGKK